MNLESQSIAAHQPEVSPRSLYRFFKGEHGRPRWFATRGEKLLGQPFTAERTRLKAIDR